MVRTVNQAFTIGLKIRITNSAKYLGIGLPNSVKISASLTDGWICFTTDGARWKHTNVPGINMARLQWCNVGGISSVTSKECSPPILILHGAVRRPHVKSLRLRSYLHILCLTIMQNQYTMLWMLFSNIYWFSLKENSHLIKYLGYWPLLYHLWSWQSNLRDTHWLWKKSVLWPPATCCTRNWSGPHSRQCSFPAQWPFLFFLGSVGVIEVRPPPIIKW